MNRRRRTPRAVDPVVVELRSRLPLPADRVWERVTTPEGIGHELRPLLSMTIPRRLRGQTIADAARWIDQPLGRAWLLLGGVLPVEYDDLRIIAVDPGRSFHERSRMLSLRQWEHQRWVTPLEDGGCEVRDRLSATPRVFGGSAATRLLVSRIVTMLFKHRHRRLQAWAKTSAQAAGSAD